MDRTKKILISLLVLGALASIGVGTFASFNASTSNTNNTFQTGTIAINETQNGASVCTSYNTVNGSNFTSNNNTGCNITLTNANTPTNAVTHTVIGVNNNGNLNGTLYLSGACSSSAVAPSGIYGNGNLCSYIGLTISPCTSYTSGSTCTTSTTACTYPASTTQACSTWEAAGAGANQIDPLITAGTPAVKADWADFATAFASPVSAGALAAAGTKYFQVDYEFFDHNQTSGSGTDNPVQGLKAATTITFTLQ